MAKNYTPSASNKEAYDKVTETAVVGTVPPQAVELGVYFMKGGATDVIFQ